MFIKGMNSILERMNGGTNDERSMELKVKSYSMTYFVLFIILIFLFREKQTARSDVKIYLRKNYFSRVFLYRDTMIVNIFASHCIRNFIALHKGNGGTIFDACIFFDLICQKLINRFFPF